MSKLAELFFAWSNLSPGTERDTAWSAYTRERDTMGGAYTCDDNSCRFKAVAHRHFANELDPHALGIRFEPIPDKVLKRNFTGSVKDRTDIKSRRERINGYKGDAGANLLEYLQETGMAYDSPRHGQRIVRVLM